MNIEILLIHEDYVTTTTTTIFTLMLLNGLLVLVEPNFRNWQKKCQKKNWMFFRKSFCTSARNRDGTLSVYKSSSVKSIWEPPLIVSFARCRSTNRFPLSLTPLLLRQIKYKSICKSPQKNEQHYRPNRAHKKRSETNFQWTDSKKLFDSGELGWAKSKIKIPQNYGGRPSFTSVSFLVDEDKRFNAG